MEVQFVKIEGLAVEQEFVLGEGIGHEKPMRLGLEKPAIAAEFEYAPSK